MSLQPEGLPSRNVELSNTIRRGWVNTAGWLRNYILSSLYRIQERDAIVSRLYQSIEEVGAFYTQYYGEAVGDRVKALYENYFKGTAAAIEAYSARDMKAFEKARANLYESADEFAALLSSVNRYLDYTTLQAMFYALVESTENQIIGTATGDYEKEVAAFEQYVQQIYNIADELTYGMIRQMTAG